MYNKNHINDEWAERRKKEDLAVMIREYSRDCLFFEKMYKKYKETGIVNFTDLEYFVGEGGKEGKLWELKEKSHYLFRNDSEYFEKKFDKKIGWAFHELKKVKEDAYEKDNYFDESQNSKENLNNSIREGMEKAKEKIDESKEFFKEILMKNRDKDLVMRIAITEKCLKDIYGNYSITDKLYPDKADTYMKLGRYFFESGWYDKSAEMYKKSLGIKPNEAVKILLEKAESKMNEQKISD